MSTCAIKGCGRAEDHVAKTVTSSHDARASNITIDEVIDRLLKGDSVPLCERDRAFVIKKIAEVSS